MGKWMGKRSSPFPTLDMRVIYQDLYGALGRIRTCDTRFRKPMLYPLSYEGGMPGRIATNPRPSYRGERIRHVERFMSRVRSTLHG